MILPGIGLENKFDCMNITIETRNLNEWSNICCFFVLAGSRPMLRQLKRTLRHWTRHPSLKLSHDWLIDYLSRRAALRGSLNYCEWVSVGLSHLMQLLKYLVCNEQKIIVDTVFNSKGICHDVTTSWVVTSGALPHQSYLSIFRPAL